MLRSEDPEGYAMSSQVVIEVGLYLLTVIVELSQIVIAVYFD